MIGNYSNEFALIIDSFGPDGTRPLLTSFGASFTPGFNAYGSYVTLIAGASVTDDAYGILINVNGIGLNTFARDTNVTIGMDQAGGTAFTDTIIDLVTGCPCNSTSATDLLQGVQWFFPLFIKAGTSIGIKGSQNQATPTAGSSTVRLFCRPAHPESIRTGSRVVTYGAVPASSCGTAITPGTTADGTYTQLGTVAAGDAPWFWTVGCGLNNAAVPGGEAHYVDLAVGSSTTVNKQIVTNEKWAVNTSESTMAVFEGANGTAAPGDLVYGRMQASGAVITGLSMAAYGVI